MIIVETDDLVPESLHKWKYWKELKEKHPNLKLTAWVPAIWQNKPENDISKSEPFKKWYEENKEWVEVQFHGFDHTKPPEFERNSWEQRQLISIGLKNMKDYLKKKGKGNTIVGFKAPFYRMDNITFDLLKKFDFDFYQNRFQIVPLKLVKNYFNNNIPIHRSPILISAHTSPEGENCPDDISIKNIWDFIDYNLARIEEIGEEYLTMGEYVARLIK